MPSRRQARLNEQLKREISEIVRRDLADPRLTRATITEVRVTADLAFARVFVRTLGAEEDRGRALEGFHAASPVVRRELGQRLRVRRVPELRFEEDRTQEEARRIEDILEEVRPPDGWDPDGGETSR
jgi:ribosome-binding factor A